MQNLLSEFTHHYVVLAYGNYDVIVNAIFIVSDMKKTDNIPDNNFNKFKRTFTIFGRQH